MLSKVDSNLELSNSESSSIGDDDLSLDTSPLHQPKEDLVKEDLVGDDDLSLDTSLQQQKEDLVNALSDDMSYSIKEGDVGLSWRQRQDESEQRGGGAIVFECDAAAAAAGGGEWRRW